MMNTQEIRSIGTQNRDVLERYIRFLPYSAQGEVLDKLQQGYESEVAPTPPQVGDLAPEFALSDSQGRICSLEEFDKPLVVSFFRGGWCDLCTIALKALQRRYAAIETFGGEVIAISPDTLQENRLTGLRSQIKFRILSDPNNLVADRYGLRSNIAPILAPIYAEYGVEFPVDCERLDVPYPATFILNAQKKIERSFIDRDPSVRMNPKDIASIIREMRQG